MFVGILTGERKPIQPPTEMTDELRQLAQHPAMHRMLKYSFVGSKATVKNKIREFIRSTKLNELIAVAAMYDSNDRIRSFQLFAELMDELNEENDQG